MALAQAERNSTFFREGEGSARLPRQTLEPDIHTQVNTGLKSRVMGVKQHLSWDRYVCGGGAKEVQCEGEVRRELNSAFSSSLLMIYQRPVLKQASLNIVVYL